MSKRLSFSGDDPQGADVPLGLCVRCLVRPWTARAFRMSVCADCARAIRSNCVAVLLGIAFVVALLPVVAHDFLGARLRDLVVLTGSVTVLLITLAGHTFVNRLIGQGRKARTRAANPMSSPTTGCS